MDARAANISPTPPTIPPIVVAITLVIPDPIPLMVPMMPEPIAFVVSNKEVPILLAILKGESAISFNARTGVPTKSANRPSRVRYFLFFPPPTSSSLRLNFLKKSRYNLLTL